MPVLKSWGATGILVEWEDMFPWEGKVMVSAGCRLGKSPISLQIQPPCEYSLPGCIRRGLFFYLKRMFRFPRAVRCFFFEIFGIEFSKPMASKVHLNAKSNGNEI